VTQDEILRMAREAGLPIFNMFGKTPDKEALERFAALVEQRVRSEIALEELAKISQELGGY
jgi:hypothetical protein